MNWRRLTIWLCLALLGGGAWARAAEPAVEKKKPEEITRYVFIIDNSATLKNELETIRKTVAYLIYNGFYGQMKKGDPFEIWTFNETVKADVIPVQYWNLELHNMLASQNYEILKNLKFEKTARMDRLMDAVQIAIHHADSLVFFLISAGEEVVVGSPVDRKINVAYGLRFEDLLTAKKPFLTTLISKRGQFTAWAVTAGDERVELNPIEYPGAPATTSTPERTSQKPEPIPPVTSSAKPTVPSVPTTPVNLPPRPPAPKPAPEAEVPPPRPRPTETIAVASPDIRKVTPPPTKPVPEVVVKAEPKPIPAPIPPEIKPVPIEAKVAKIEEAKIQTPIQEPIRPPIASAPERIAPPEIQKPNPPPPAARVEAPVAIPASPKIEAAPPIKPDSTPKAEVKTVAVPIPIPIVAPSLPQHLPAPVTPQETKAPVIVESKPPPAVVTPAPENTVPPLKPAVPGTLVTQVKTGLPREPAPITATVASTPARPSLSPGLLAGVALLAVAGWIGVLLFRRSRPAAPSFISRSMDDRE